MQNKEWILAGFFAGFTVLGTFFRIPFGMVPLTLHVLMVLLSGFVLGPKFGMFSQIIFLLLGLAGLPVFSGGGGIGYIFSPTFGYLLSYPIAAWIVGHISGGGRESFPRFAVSALAGIAVIYILGTSVLYLNINYLAGKELGFYQAVTMGVFPFIVPDLLKGGVASLFALKICPLLGVRRHLIAGEISKS